MGSKKKAAGRRPKVSVEQNAGPDNQASKAAGRRQKASIEQNAGPDSQASKTSVEHNDKYMPPRFLDPPFDQKPYLIRENFFKQPFTAQQLRNMAQLQAEMFNRPCPDPTHKHTVVSDAECLQLFQHMNEIHCQKKNCDCAKAYTAEQKLKIQEAFVRLPGMCKFAKDRRNPRPKRKSLLKRYIAASGQKHPWSGAYIDPDAPYQHCNVDEEKDRLTELMANVDLDKEHAIRYKSSRRQLDDFNQNLEKLRLVYHQMHYEASKTPEEYMNEAARLAQKLMLGANEFHLRRSRKCIREVSEDCFEDQQQEKHDQPQGEQGSNPQQQEEQSNGLSFEGKEMYKGKGKERATLTAEQGTSEEAEADKIKQMAAERGMMLGSHVTVQWPSAVNPFEECLSAIATKGRMHCQPGLPCPSCKYVIVVRETRGILEQPNNTWTDKWGNAYQMVCEPLTKEQAAKQKSSDEVFDPLRGASKDRDEILKRNGLV